MLTLYTSSSTDQPKTVTHSWQYINNQAIGDLFDINIIFIKRKKNTNGKT